MFGCEVSAEDVKVRKHPGDHNETVVRCSTFGGSDVCDDVPDRSRNIIQRSRVRECNQPV